MIGKLKSKPNQQPRHSKRFLFTLPHKNQSIHAHPTTQVEKIRTAAMELAQMHLAPDPLHRSMEVAHLKDLASWLSPASVAGLGGGLVGELMHLCKHLRMESLSSLRLMQDIHFYLLEHCGEIEEWMDGLMEWVGACEAGSSLWQKIGYYTRVWMVIDICMEKFGEMGLRPRQSDTIGSSILHFILDLIPRLIVEVSKTHSAKMCQQDSQFTGNEEMDSQFMRNNQMDSQFMGNQEMESQIMEKQEMESQIMGNNQSVNNQRVNNQLVNNQLVNNQRVRQCVNVNNKLCSILNEIFFKFLGLCEMWVAAHNQPLPSSVSAVLQQEQLITNFLKSSRIWHNQHWPSSLIIHHHPLLLHLDLLDEVLSILLYSVDSIVTLPEIRAFTAFVCTLCEHPQHHSEGRVFLHKWVRICLYRSSSAEAIQALSGSMGQGVAVQVFRCLFDEDGGLAYGSLINEAIWKAVEWGHSMSGVTHLLVALAEPLSADMECLSCMWMVLNREMSRPDFESRHNLSILRLCTYIHIYLTFRQHLGKVCKGGGSELRALEARMGDSLGSFQALLSDPRVASILDTHLFSVCLLLPQYALQLWPVAPFIAQNLHLCCQSSLQYCYQSSPQNYYSSSPQNYYSSSPQYCQQSQQCCYPSSQEDCYQPIGTEVREIPAEINDLLLQAVMKRVSGMKVDQCPDEGFYCLLYLLHANLQLPYSFVKMCLGCTRLEVASMLAGIRASMEGHPSYRSQHFEAEISVYCNISQEKWVFYLLLSALNCQSDPQRLLKLMEAFTSMQRARLQTRQTQSLPKLGILALLEPLIRNLCIKFLENAEPSQQAHRILVGLRGLQPSPSAHRTRHKVGPKQSRLQQLVYSNILYRDLLIKMRQKSGTNPNRQPRLIHKVLVDNLP